MFTRLIEVAENLIAFDLTAKIQIHIFCGINFAALRLCEKASGMGEIAQNFNAEPAEFFRKAR